ncbi:MAG: D-alanyl-D-alanine carboxypeptidase family protein [Evtepia gabavorous]
MLKAIAVASGNDACVAMAEYLAGSESTFVEKMNARAAELGMENTVFVNCTGLPAEGHHSSAYDIALMSRALIQNHPDIRTYTTIWMDTLRDGTFQLANTNKLIRFYEGATGLKTGSTDAALYCVSATAEKDGMELIAVVLGSPTSADRFETAKALLNYGFAGYSLVTVAPSEPISPIPVTLGTADSVQPVLTQESQIPPSQGRGRQGLHHPFLPDTLQAPVEKGQELGSLTVLVDGKENQKLPLVAQEEVPRLTLWAVYQSLLGTLFCGT